MKRLVDAETAGKLDQRTQARFGLSGDQLMENAAAGMYRRLEASGFLPADGTADSRPAIVALCGKGNNAGDALAMLRMAAFAGKGAMYAIVPPGLGEVAQRRAKEAELAGVRLVPAASPEASALAASARLVLDAVSGTGLRGPLREPAASIARLASLARGPVGAIDVPSGTGAFDADAAAPREAVLACATLAIAPIKAELYFPGYRGFAGTIDEVDGVFPADEDFRIALLEPCDLGALLPGLSLDSHKGDRGALGIHGGATGTLGAALLAARGGSAAGAGTVTLMVPDGLYPSAAAALSAQMVRPASSGPGRPLDALVVGPGIGRDGRATEIVAEALATDLPLVLDADGLRLGCVRVPRASGAPLILTPHPGEFAPLGALAAGMDPLDPEALRIIQIRCRFDTLSIVRLAAAAFDCVLVLKGSVTWMAAPDGRAAAWDGRNPALATGGSGDVLAGLLGGLLARGADPWDAARAAVIAHGLAGRSCADRLGFFDASALPEAAAAIVYRGGPHGNQR